MRTSLTRLWISWLAAAALLTLPLACGAEASEDTLNRTVLRECQCGTVESDTLGCASECALAGPELCENPLCTCERDPAYKKTDKGGQR